MKRAQLLTIDFILSLAIFISIVLTLITIWGSIDTQVRDVENRRELQSMSISVSDLLIRSPGNPDEWTASDVQSIGLSAGTERVLSLQKIFELFKVDYYSAKSRIRLGGTSQQLYEEKTYEFQLFFTDTEGNNLTGGPVRSPIAYYSRDPNRALLLSSLSSSGTAWDLFWGAPLGQLPAAFGYRTLYNQPALAQQKDFINELIANQSNYRTIILEDPAPSGFGSSNSDLNISGLQEFASRGGILIVVGQDAPGRNIIDLNFSAKGEYDLSGVGWGDGNISYPGYLFPSELSGKSVGFGRSRWYFHSIDNGPKVEVFVSKSGEPENGMVCRWQYGFGWVYYIEDVDGSIEGGINLVDAIRAIGQQLKFGLSPSMQSQVVSVRRTAILEGFDREPVGMLLRVWK